MRAVVCEALGPPESLVVRDIAAPDLTPDGVRIRVHAAGVNFMDTLIIKGEYQVKPELPFVPGAEVAGDVVEVGEQVTLLTPGQRVAAMLPSNGGYAEEVVVHEAAAFPIPDDMSYAEGAALLLQYGTSMHALAQRGNLKTGETLLVHAASGGVGLAAVEIGKAMGATVIGTGGDDAKLAIATERGADHVLNYRTANIKEDVNALTGGKGADVIYDAVGGDIFDASMRCIAWNGRLLVIGFAAGRIPTVTANLLLVKGCSVVGVFFGRFAMTEPAVNRANMDRLFDMYRAGQVRPHISHELPLADVAAALNALLDRQVVGKAVLTI